MLNKALVSPWMRLGENGNNPGAARIKAESATLGKYGWAVAGAPWLVDDYFLDFVTHTYT